MEDDIKNYSQMTEQVTAVCLGDKFMAIGTETGYKIFSLNPIKLIKHKDMGGGIGLIGFYNSDKIIWFVGGGDLPAVPTNELRLWDNHIDEQLCKFVQKSPIKNVWVKSEHLFLTLVDKVYLHTLPPSDQITSFDTVENPYSVIAMSKNEDTNIIVFLDKEDFGSLIIYDYDKKVSKWKIEGNQDDEFYITCLAITDNGEALAVTSSEGCTIHIYNTMNGSKIQDYTRGSVPAHFQFLQFQLNDSRLLVGADTGTLHIFMVGEDIRKQQAQDHQPKNVYSSFYFLGGLIPYLGKVGSYWKFRVYDSWVVTAMMPSESAINALSTKGKIYLGTINVEEGGVAILENTTTLNDRIMVQEEEKSLAQ